MDAGGVESLLWRGSEVYKLENFYQQDDCTYIIKDLNDIPYLRKKNKLQDHRVSQTSTDLAGVWSNHTLARSL